MKLFDYLTLMDSFSFVRASLDQLGGFSVTEAFRKTRKEFTGNYGLATKKLAYPYDYFHEKEDYDRPIIEKNEYFRRSTGKNQMTRK